jgi:hypothetical protein
MKACWLRGIWAPVMNVSRLFRRTLSWVLVVAGAAGVGYGLVQGLAPSRAGSTALGMVAQAGSGPEASPLIEPQG